LSYEPTKPPTPDSGEQVAILVIYGIIAAFIVAVICAGIIASLLPPHRFSPPAVLATSSPAVEPSETQSETAEPTDEPTDGPTDEPTDAASALGRP
jgi:hypothetical protein